MEKHSHGQEGVQKGAGCGVGIFSLGAYVPGKKLTTEFASALGDYLRRDSVHFPTEYIEQIEAGSFPGRLQTNEEGWGSQPWYDEWFARLPEHRKEDPFYGVKSRPRRPYDPESLRRMYHPHPMWQSDAAALAGAVCIVKSGIDPAEIDAVINSNFQNDFLQIPDAPAVAHKLGIVNAISCIDATTACSSFQSTYDLAGQRKNVLVTSASINSLTQDPTETEVPPVLGDAAGAVLVRRIEDEFGFVSSGQSLRGDLHHGVVTTNRVRTLNFPLHRQIAGVMNEYVTGDFLTFSEDFFRDVAKSTTVDFVKSADAALSRADLTHEDIQFMTTHQLGDRITKKWADAFNVPVAKFFTTAVKYGNLGGATIQVNLEEAIERGVAKGGEVSLFSSTGGGIQYYSIIERLSPSLVKNVLRYGAIDFD